MAHNKRQSDLTLKLMSMPGANVRQLDDTLPYMPPQILGILKPDKHKTVACYVVIFSVGLDDSMSLILHLAS